MQNSTDARQKLISSKWYVVSYSNLGPGISVLKHHIDIQNSFFKCPKSYVYCLSGKEKEKRQLI
jgi:hypothetical protein